MEQQRAREEGRLEGREEGRLEEQRKAIHIFISEFLAEGISAGKILEKLQKNFWGGCTISQNAARLKFDTKSSRNCSKYSVRAYCISEAFASILKRFLYLLLLSPAPLHPYMDAMVMLIPSYIYPRSQPIPPFYNPYL